MQNRCRVALIRGINVGKAKRVAMADLRALVEGLGYSNVRTLLNSGNIVFDVPAKVSDKAGPRIEAAMSKELGVSANVTVLTASELADIMAKNPLAKVADDPSHLLVAVWRSPEDRASLEPLLKQKWDPEAFALGKRAAYLWFPAGIIRSKLMEAIDRALRDRVTSRNWSTMEKLAAMTRSE